ncbi:hypothetical protein [Alteribacillus sp. HJP-4]|uniref:hypothetical protein n=1 Tax=Alteribacillus sp. HJP-4 TaxID=2775394 RepID=UPI0035CCF26B
MSDHDKETTENIEKSMQESHGVSKEEYERSVDKKIEVEKKREKDHKENKDLTNEINTKIKK